MASIYNEVQGEANSGGSWALGEVFSILFRSSCISILLGSAALAAGSYELIALEGASAGAGKGNFNSFRDYVLNDDGRITFTGSTSLGDDFIAVAQPEPARIFALADTQAPGVPAGVEFAILAFFGNAHLNDAGGVAFYADLQGPGISSSNREGIWVGDPDNLQLLARTGQFAPGTGGESFDYFDVDLQLANNGVVGFVGHLEDFSSGIWMGTPNDVAAVALEGSPTPGLAGGTFGPFQFFGIHANLSRQGKIAFSNSVDDGGVGTAGIWTGTPGNLQLVAYEGMPIPGYGAGAEILTLAAAPQINDLEQIAFAVSAGTEDPFEPNDALFLKTSAGIEPVYSLGEVPPGFPAGSKYDFQLGFHLGGDRKIVFQNWVDVPGAGIAEALFAHEDGENRLVVEEGDAIPGAVGNLHYSYFRRYYINESGRVAFMSDFAGDTTGRGIWAEDASGELIEIARTGTQIEIAPGIVRTITALSWPDPQIGYSPMRAYNSSGQIVFKADFDSISAVLLYTPAGVPGDYNGNGVVDAADYTVWRDHFGSNANLPNDETPGSVTSGDYTVWKTHFGQSAGSGSLSRIDSAVAVPESSSALVVLAGLATVALRGRRK